jgi:hypothetical protein
MPQRTVVLAAAWHEIVVAATILIAPDVAWVLLFAARAEGEGMPLTRFAGGCACGARHRHSAFNVGVFVLLRGWAPLPRSAVCCCGLRSFCMPLSQLYCSRSFWTKVHLNHSPLISEIWPGGNGCSQS